MKWFKEANGNLEHTTRSVCANTGSPKRGDPHGDGAAIVVRAREESNLVHGEGRQVSLESKERKGA